MPIKVSRLGTLRPISMKLKWRCETPASSDASIWLLLRAPRHWRNSAPRSFVRVLFFDLDIVFNELMSPKRNVRCSPAALPRVLECHRADRPVPVRYFRWILLIHVKEVSHRRPDGLLSRIIGFHGYKAPKHLERSTVPVFHDLVVRGKSVVDEGTKILADSLAPMPIADTEIGNGVFLEAVKAFAPCLVVDLTPEREKPIRCGSLGESSRSHIGFVHRSSVR